MLLRTARGHWPPRGDRTDAYLASYPLCLSTAVQRRSFRLPVAVRSASALPPGIRDHDRGHDGIFRNVELVNRVA